MDHYETRRIAEIKADLMRAKRDLRALYGRLGDDFGVDGTAEEAKALRGWISTYESELAEARAARKGK